MYCCLYHEENNIFIPRKKKNNLYATTNCSYTTKKITYGYTTKILNNYILTHVLPGPQQQLG